jgi:2-keto-4-pentenoate hydratase/2-oxohepta-3-ene-1,7-dioic acid hydratase in catechol pathway
LDLAFHPDMTQWVRFEIDDRQGFGQLENQGVCEFDGNLFLDPVATNRFWPLECIRLLPPCNPGKFLGLWNNFAERAQKENLHRPGHPLYFMKPANSYAGPGDNIRRPAGYPGMLVFEGELGIVIGSRCAGIPPSQAEHHIFGYTCVNDVTARDLLRQDPAFVHWTRAKGFDSFGVFGPCIATGLDPAALHIKVRVNGEEHQNYPVADMFFSPFEIVSLLSHDMTLESGDLIACGTSVGAGAMRADDVVEVEIEGVGVLSNKVA